MNNLEETLNDRHQQLNLAHEHRQSFDRILTKLNEWIKNTTQQMKDPLTNDLQQTANVLKEKSRNMQVRKHFYYNYNRENFKRLKVKKKIGQY